MHGARDLQAAALPAGMRHVVYVPERHAYGTDTFEYRASDCPGNLFRYSNKAIVSFDIAAVNDAPVASVLHPPPIFTDQSDTMQLVYSDVDDTSKPPLPAVSGSCLLCAL